MDQREITRHLLSCGAVGRDLRRDSRSQTLGIRCLVNGEVMQDSSTAAMVFGVDELISFVSQGITLEPGDLIATGTPAGVGFTRRPPRFLSRGDVVRVEIDKVGSLQNDVS